VVVFEKVTNNAPRYNESKVMKQFRQGFQWQTDFTVTAHIKNAAFSTM